MPSVSTTRTTTTSGTSSSASCTASICSTCGLGSYPDPVEPDDEDDDGSNDPPAGDPPTTSPHRTFKRGDGKIRKYDVCLGPPFGFTLSTDIIPYPAAEGSAGTVENICRNSLTKHADCVPGITRLGDYETITGAVSGGTPAGLSDITCGWSFGIALSGDGEDENGIAKTYHSQSAMIALT